MPRLLGVDIPNDKKLGISLTYLYGVGPNRAEVICRETGMDYHAKARDVKDDELARIAAYVDKTFSDENVKDGRDGPVEGALRRKVQQNVTRLKKIGAYRGLRHIRGLPTRGQRTRTNARTRKGPRRAVRK